MRSGKFSRRGLGVKYTRCGAWLAPATHGVVEQEPTSVRVEPEAHRGVGTRYPRRRKNSFAFERSRNPAIDCRSVADSCRGRNRDVHRYRKDLERLPAE